MRQPWTGARLWRFSRARWAIEVLFRDLKQSLGFGSLTAGGEGGAHVAVTSIRLDQEIWASEKGKSLGSIVKKHRELALEKSIESMVHNQSSGRLAKLKARRKNPNQKPRDFCGGKKSA